MSNPQATKKRVDLKQAEFTRLYGLAYLWHKNLFARDLCHEDWQELASEAVYRVIAAMEKGKYDSRKASVDTFLRAVARNLAIDHNRRARRRLSRVVRPAEWFDACDPHASEALEAAVESLSYQQLLHEFGPDIDSLLDRAGLTPEQQAAFKMTVLTDMTSGEIGSVLGVSAEAVRSRILTARRKLEAFRERIAREKR